MKCFSCDTQIPAGHWRCPSCWDALYRSKARGALAADDFLARWQEFDTIQQEMSRANAYLRSISQHRWGLFCQTIADHIVAVLRQVPDGLTNTQLTTALSDLAAPNHWSVPSAVKTIILPRLVETGRIIQSKESRPNRRGVNASQIVYRASEVGTMWTDADDRWMSEIGVS